MPVENNWYQENRILLTRLVGDVTVEDMVASSQRGTQLIESGIAPVYSLVDMTQLTHFPMKLKDVKVISEQGTSPKLGLMIIYGISNRMLSFLASTFTQFLRTNYKVVNSLEDALALIEKLELKPR